MDYVTVATILEPFFQGIGTVLGEEPHRSEGVGVGGGKWRRSEGPLAFVALPFPQEGTVLRNAFPVLSVRDDADHVLDRDDHGTGQQQQGSQNGH